ncbi:MAG: hypothetical protein HYR66_08170 [Sphingobacteriales bacterium]|nr:hypothetical protein [Sphingobacteriales bacterium]MBI3720453.1 hypothetical protein [Sphingobacteriales bacterium]
MKVRFVLYSLLMLLLTACSSSRITHSWKAENVNAKKFNKIMVVALIQDNDVMKREKMEEHLIGDLNEKGVSAVSSLKEYGPKSFEGMKEEEVLNKLQNSGVDAVLTIVLLDKQRERYYVPGRVYYSPYVIYHRRFWRYYNTMYDRIYSPGYYQINTRYFWESNLYDLSSKELLYSVQTESFEPESAQSLGHEYGKLIVKDMFEKNVLAK